MSENETPAPAPPSAPSVCAKCGEPPEYEGHFPPFDGPFDHSFAPPSAPATGPVLTRRDTTQEALDRLVVISTGWRVERDALRAEVERLHAGDEQRVRDITRHIERADKAEAEVERLERESRMNYDNAEWLGKKRDAAEAEVERDKELLIEAGRWARYEGFWRLADNINRHLGGTFCGWEHIPKIGPDDEPWVSETEEKAKTAEARVGALETALREAKHYVECFAHYPGETAIGSVKLDIPKDGYPRQYAVNAAQDTLECIARAALAGEGK